jgi:hypothetical protein
MNNIKVKSGVMMLGMMLVIGLANTSVLAQDVVTDEELLNYAKVMTQIDSMKVEMKSKISTEVKENEMMDGGRMYNALNKAKDDQTKIDASGASEEQLVAYAQIKEAIAAYKTAFKTQYTAVVKNDIGGTTFNKVKKAIKADPDLKIKYDALLASLTASAEEVEGE